MSRKLNKRTLLIGGLTALALVAGAKLVYKRMSHSPEQRARIELLLTFNKLSDVKKACGSFPKNEFFVGGDGECFERSNLSKIRMKDFWGNEYGYFTDGTHLFLRTTYPVGLIVDENGAVYVAPESKR